MNTIRRNNRFVLGLAIALISLAIVCLLVLSLQISAMVSVPRVGQSTVIVATMYPVPTVTVEPTATVVPAPTPMSCTPDDVGQWSDYDDLHALEDAGQVTWMTGGSKYSVFLIPSTSQQVCVGVGDSDVSLIENRLTPDGLSESVSWSYQKNFTGKFTIDWSTKEITIETPQVIGPNDELVRSVWPVQMKRINQAGTWLFKEPIFDEGYDYSLISPAYLCDQMGEWEEIAPLPKNVSFCTTSWYYEMDSYLGRGYWLTDYANEDALVLKVFWIKPETVYFDENEWYPTEPIRFEFAGPLQVGQQLATVAEVLGTCEEPEKYDREDSWFRDPVALRISSIWYDIIVPRGSFIGVGTYDGKGWEKIYSVCP